MEQRLLQVRLSQFGDKLTSTVTVVTTPSNCADNSSVNCASMVSYCDNPTYYTLMSSQVYNTSLDIYIYSALKLVIAVAILLRLL